MAEIHPRLQDPALRFVLLGSSGEALKRPFEARWQETANYPHDDPKISSHLGNIGICGGFGGLHILDCDDTSRWEELAVFPLVPRTFTIESRPGHRQYYIRCPEHFPSGGLYDPEKTTTNEAGKPEYVHIGDLKAGSKDGICGGQAVTPGSRHPSGSTYQVVVDAPIAEVEKEHLQSIINKFRQSKKFDTNCQKAEELVKQARQRRYGDRDPLDSLRVQDIMPPAGAVFQSGDELRGDHPVHGSTNGGNYVVNTAKNVWHCKRCEAGGGPALAIAVKHGLISCSDASPGALRGDLFKQVLKIAREGYGMAGNGNGRGRGAEAEARPEGEEECPEASEGIRAEALDILRHGDPIKYIVDQCGQMVLGAEKAFRKLVCCVAVQGVKQSAGLHPKLAGESGAGKTAAIYAFSHLLPAEAVVKGSSSNLAAFYHSDGNSVFRILDDYQAGNETLDTIIKQTTSVFHRPYDHRTVKKQEALTLHIGSEQTWAVTSVDSSQDIQVLNRQIPINVDDGEELTRRVNARTIERYGKGEEQFLVGDTVLVCREIWRVLRGDGLINVRVPYFERIEWLDTSNRRNPSIFMDLLVAHTAMFRYQREQDSEGFFLSTEADFEAAKALFTDKDAQELVYRLTKKEREFADLLTKHPSGLTREAAAEALHISGNRISQLANGEKGKGGLTQKLPGFSIVEITDSERLDEDHHRATKKVLYRLTMYDPLTGFESVVRLRPENDDGGDSKDGKEPVSLPVRKPENKENDNRERENREKEIESKDSKEKLREGGSGPVGSPKHSLSLSNPEKSLLRENSIASGLDAILTECDANPYRPYSMAADIECKSLPGFSRVEAPSRNPPDEPQQAGKDTAARIRAAALMEFGTAGWVDPAKLAHALKLPPDEVEAWLRANYMAFDRPGGGVGYRQRRAGEGVPA